MAIKTIAIISPGDMGGGIGKVFVQEGYQVLTCLEGRSTLTKELAQKAGFQDTPNLATLLSQADCLISIVPPESAVTVPKASQGKSRAQIRDCSTWIAMRSLPKQLEG